MLNREEIKKILNNEKPLVEIVHNNNEKEHKKFVNFNTIRKNWLLLAIVCGCMIIGGVVALVLNGLFVGIVIILTSLLLPAIMLISSTVSAKGYLSKNSWYLEYKNIYKFYDKYLYVRSENKKNYYESLMTFKDLFRIYITKKNIYVYLSKQKAIIIEKKEIQDHDLEILKKLLEVNFSEKTLKGKI